MRTFAEATISEGRSWPGPVKFPSRRRVVAVPGVHAGGQPKAPAQVLCVRLLEDLLRAKLICRPPAEPPEAGQRRPRRRRVQEGSALADPAGQGKAATYA
eukprot:scaffold14878_cov41-Prasinocladus_malaysianus.AAC.2